MEKIRVTAEKMKKCWNDFCSTVKNGKAELDFYRDLFGSEEGKITVKKLWEQLWYLLKKIKPSKIEGEVIFGSGDPALTGQILGAIAVFYGVFPKKLQLIPDFEEQRYEGRVCAKGKIRLIHIVIVLCRLVIDKNFRYIAKQLFAKEGAENE